MGEQPRLGDIGRETGRSALTGERVSEQAVEEELERATDAEAAPENIADRSPRSLRAVPDPEPPRRVGLIDLDTGERVNEGCPACLAKDDEMAGLEETVRSQGAKIRKLRRNKDAEARGSSLWPQAVELVRYWREACGHPRSRMNIDRFYIVEPFLKSDGIDLCKLAVDGAAHDPYKADRPNRNGKVEVYDGIETIFKNRSSFERHCNRAPAERRRQLAEAHLLDEPYTELELKVRASIILELTLEAKGMDRPTEVQTRRALTRAREELRKRPSVELKERAK